MFDHRQDTFLRPDQHRLLNGTATEHLVDMGYNRADGRLQAVIDNTTAAAQTFTYGYESNNYGLLETLTSPVHTVTNGYESNRDILDTKTNASTVGTTGALSAYNYTVNSIGQRINVARSGSAISAANSIGWTYNNRGELVEEDFGANGSNDTRDRVYAYDGIGNREKSDQGTLSIPTANNYVANALNEYTSIEAVSPSYDDDGNATAYPLPADVSTNATLVWDAENRLISATLSGGVSYTYEYDYLSLIHI